MPNPYLEHRERWLAYAEIDYLINYVKAWIPFNAWYKNSYPTLSRDRDIINEIKSNSNLFRDKIIALLQGNDPDSIAFKAQIGRLHNLLEGTYIPNPDKRISFTSIVIEKNQTLVATNTFRRWTYKVEVIYTGTTNYTINTLVTNVNGLTKFTYSQNRFDPDQISNEVESNSQLNQVQSAKLMENYHLINPNKPVSLISSSPRGSLDIGGLYFISDPYKLTKAIIEIFYRLRNILFHGELNPSQSNKKVYQPAFYMLNSLLSSLN